MKKNNKGFTLIELLGVIVILIAIIALVIPKILGNARSKKSTVATIDNDIVMSAVKLYVEEHKKDYPEINGNTYCISTNGTEWNEIKSKYLAKNTNYNDNSMIKVVYNGKYVFSNDNSCSPVSTDPQHCSPESACRSCLVEKKYINGNYQYSSRIIANVNNTNIQNIFQLNEILYVNDDNSCVYQAILKAAQDYVASKPDYFINNENINYCISVSELESKGLLKTGLIYNGESVSNKSIKAKYNLQANQFTYSGLSNSCTASTICLVKQEYINQKKRYSPEIVNENTNINLQNETLYIDNNDECTYQAILKAAQAYVASRPKHFIKRDGANYCISVSELVSRGFLTGVNQSVQTKIIQVSYNSSSNQFVYSGLLNAGQCTEPTPMCTAQTNYTHRAELGARVATVDANGDVNYNFGDVYLCRVTDDTTVRAFLFKVYTDKVELLVQLNDVDKTDSMYSNEGANFVYNTSAWQWYGSNDNNGNKYGPVGYTGLLNSIDITTRNWKTEPVYYSYNNTISCGYSGITTQLQTDGSLKTTVSRTITQSCTSSGCEITNIKARALSLADFDASPIKGNKNISVTLSPWMYRVQGHPNYSTSNVIRDTAFWLLDPYCDSGYTASNNVYIIPTGFSGQTNTFEVYPRNHWWNYPNPKFVISVYKNDLSCPSGCSVQ